MVPQVAVGRPHSLSSSLTSLTCLLTRGFLQFFVMCAILEGSSQSKRGWARWKLESSSNLTLGPAHSYGGDQIGHEYQEAGIIEDRFRRLPATMNKRVNEWEKRRKNNLYTHTSIYFALIHCSLKIPYFLQIEGKMLHQQKD